LVIKNKNKNTFDLKSENSAEAEEEKCHRKKKRTRETLKNLCIKNKAWWWWWA
jgi:hypothetical protein